MFQYADNCTEALMLSRTAFFSLYDQYGDLETEAKTQRDSVQIEKLAKNKALEEVVKQTDRKVLWRRIAVGEGIILAGATFAIISGAWIPALAVTAIADTVHISKRKK